MANKSLNTSKEDANRTLKFIIIPSLIFAVGLTVLVPQFIASGIIAFVLIGVSFMVYTSKRFQKNVVGIPKNIYQGYAWGFALFVFFIFLMVFNPIFALGVPTAPQAIFDLSIGALVVGNAISIALIGFLYPAIETTFKISIYSVLVTLYPITKGWAVAIVATMFAFLHSLAYGVSIAVAKTFGILAQDITAISSLLLVAGIFGTLATILMLRTRNVLPIAIAHMGINLAIMNVIFAFIIF